MQFKPGDRVKCKGGKLWCLDLEDGGYYSYEAFVFTEITYVKESTDPRFEWIRVVFWDKTWARRKIRKGQLEPLG